MKPSPEQLQNALPRLRLMREEKVNGADAAGDRKGFLVAVAETTALDIAIAAVEQLAKEGAH